MSPKRIMGRSIVAGIAYTLWVAGIVALRPTWLQSERATRY